MTDSEKWAWWTLGVIAVTILAWVTFVVILGNDRAANSVFSLLPLALLVPRLNPNLIPNLIPIPPNIHTWDERESAIAHKALLAGMRALLVTFVGLVIGTGNLKGWDTTVTIGQLSSGLWWAFMIIWAVEAIVTLRLYREGNA